MDARHRDCLFFAYYLVPILLSCRLGSVWPCYPGPKSHQMAISELPWPRVVARKIPRFWRTGMHLPIRRGLCGNAALAGHDATSGFVNAFSCICRLIAREIYPARRRQRADSRLRQSQPIATIFTLSSTYYVGRALLFF